MEYPYIAILWTTENSLQTHHVETLITKIRHDAQWYPTLSRDGIAVFTRKPHATFLDAYPLAGKAGIILGTLFRQGGGSRLSLREIAEDADLAECCLRSRGAHLTKSYWGCYVALLSHPQADDWSIVRDCSGMIPCYYTSKQGITIAFADIRDLDLLFGTPDHDGLGLQLEINWRYVLGFLASSQMQIRDTGLKDVYELLAGESLESVAGRRTVRALWNPVPIVDHNPSVKVDIEDSCRVLRQTARSCIAAWAGTQDKMLLSLSGGFDSSLVLSLLKAAPRRPNVLCVNRFASGPGEDERGYARGAALWAQADLLELPWDGESMLFGDHCLRLPRTAKPTLSHLFNGLDAPLYNRLGITHGCDTLWTGQGGDHLFMAANTDLGVVDCLVHHGLLSSQMATTLRDTAKLTRKSLIHLIRLAIGRSMRLRKGRSASRDAFFNWTDLLPQTHYLAPDLLPSDWTGYIRHPWTAPSAAVLPGKRYQLLLLAEVLNRHRPLYGLQEVQEFHPLLSQPLIEACLRIPVYLLLVGGQTRGLARLAFKDCLFPGTVARHGKGETTHFTLSLVRRSLPFLTDVLLDGVLVRQGLLNRSTLQTALRPNTPIDWTALFPLCACFAAELWAQAWASPATASHRPPSFRPPSLDRNG